ncbi:hypothetical protein cypCar_00022453, partial [Cyprinus carpio]
MSLLSVLRSPRLSFLQTLLSLLLSLVSLSSSYWCVGRQKVPKPLCSPSRRLRCTPVHGVSDGSFSWETGDDRFIFPSFHAGLWTTCEENIFTDALGQRSRGQPIISLNNSNVFILKKKMERFIVQSGDVFREEKCRSFMALTPASEKGNDTHTHTQKCNDSESLLKCLWIVWLYVGMELLYIALLCVSSLLLLLQLCLSSWFPPQQRWGQLLNAFAAVCTVLGGLVGMVAHMMYMQVFQVTISLGPEDFKPHSYGYSWAF